MKRGAASHATFPCQQNRWRLDRANMRENGHMTDVLSKWTLRGCVSSLLMCASLAVGGPEPRKEVRVLTIGNSFADNALRHLPRIVTASGNRLIYAKANLGGCSLERHWKHMKAHEASPDDPAGKPYRGKSLQELLSGKPWNVVTIQQVSWLSHDLKTYEPYAGELCATIRKHAPQAKIMLHQIWAYRDDDPRFVPANEGRAPHTHRLMYEQVRAANHATASTYGLDILPSGDAMYLADTDSRMGFQPDPTFDRKAAQPKKLPDQAHSLHVGFAWRSKKNQRDVLELKYDGHHANRNGEYLIGCVWFECFFGDSVVPNTHVPRSMAPDYAAFLRRTAHRAVESLKQEGFLHDAPATIEAPPRMNPDVPQAGTYLIDLNTTAEAAGGVYAEHPGGASAWNIYATPADIDGNAISDTTGSKKTGIFLDITGTVTDSATKATDIFNNTTGGPAWVTGDGELKTAAAAADYFYTRVNEEGIQSFTLTFGNLKPRNRVSIDVWFSRGRAGSGRYDYSLNNGRIWFPFTVLEKNGTVSTTGGWNAKSTVTRPFSGSTDGNKEARYMNASDVLLTGPSLQIRVMDSSESKHCWSAISAVRLQVSE